MMQSLFAGVSGLRSHQRRMDVIGNNVANVNTVGFKSARTTFQDVLYNTLRGAGAPQNDRGGTNPMQVGLGVQVGSIDTVFTGGNPQSTGVETDLMIQGEGLFVVSDGERTFYTRAGNFYPDGDGTLVGPGGYKVMGWSADSAGNIDTFSPVGALRVEKGSTINATATSNVTLAGNVDSAQLVPIATGNLAVSGSLETGSTSAVQLNEVVYDEFGFAHHLALTLTYSGAGNDWNVEWSLDGSTPSLPITFTPGDTVPVALGPMSVNTGATDISINLDVSTTASVPSGSPSSISVSSNDGKGDILRTPAKQVFDSLGSAHEVYLAFGQTGTLREWSVVAYRVDKTSPAGFEVLSTAPYTMTFDADGRLPAALSDLSLTLNPGNGANPLDLNFAIAGLTQLAGDTTAKIASQDGFPSGTLERFAFDSNGIITGYYSNGLRRSLGQVAMATFANPGGLERQGESLFAESPNSGTADVGAANSGGRGAVLPSTLEMSNVDLAQEFTDMILTQRGYQANSRVITTSDEMLQELVNLKR